MTEAELEQVAELIAERSSIRSSLLDAKQTSETLTVPASWLLDQARAGKVPHSRLGTYVRFDRDQLWRWATEDQHRGPR